MTLYQITFTVNFIALIASLWLGMYLVTRNPRVPTAWLTALTLWSLSGLFLNVLLALNPLPDPTFRPAGLRFLFPFWPSGMFDEGATGKMKEIASRTRENGSSHLVGRARTNEPRQ